MGALTYNSWPLAYVVDTGLHQTSTFASEYEAIGHPWAWLFRAADVVTGLFIGVGAVAAFPWTRSLPLRWLMRVVLIATAVIGFTTAITGSLPVDCSYSNGQCRAIRAAGHTQSWHDLAHHTISDGSGSAFSIALSVLVIAVALGAAAASAHRWAVLLLVLALSTSSVFGDLFWSPARQGIPQRLDEVVEALFVLVLAIDLDRPAVPGWGWAVRIAGRRRSNSAEIF
jgi:hypothetical protein